jgi:RNA polymerase sigma-70 factor (ECF subfamily)
MSRVENEFLERLVHEMHNILLSYAGIRVADYDSAYDVVQETYLAAQKNIDKLMLSENPKGWLIETLKNKVLHEKRAKARFYMLTQKMAMDGAQMTSAGDIYDSDMIDLLNKDEYYVLRKAFVEGFSIKEIADLLGITYETCKKRIQAAKRKLAQEL